jgi:hypothetical protein
MPPFAEEGGVSLICGFEGSGSSEEFHPNLEIQESSEPVAEGCEKTKDELAGEEGVEVVDRPDWGASACDIVSVFEANDTPLRSEVAAISVNGTSVLANVAPETSSEVTQDLDQLVSLLGPDK